MNRILVFVVFVPLAIILIALAVANRTSVPFTIDPFNPGNPGLTLTAPLFVFLFASVAIGLVVGSVATWLRQGRYRKLARERGQEVKHLRDRPPVAPAGPALPKTTAPTA